MYIYDDSSSEYFQSLLQAKKQPVWQKYSTYGQVTNRYYSLTIDAKMVASRPRFEQF